MICLRKFTQNKSKVLAFPFHAAGQRGSRLFSFHLARKLTFIDGGLHQRHLQMS
jgi:hypothetical protein